MTGEDRGEAPESESAPKQEEPVLKPQNLPIRTVRAAENRPQSRSQTDRSHEPVGTSLSYEEDHRRTKSRHRRSESRLTAVNCFNIHDQEELSGQSETVGEPVPAPGPHFAHMALNKSRLVAITRKPLRDFGGESTTCILER